MNMSSAKALAALILPISLLAGFAAEAKPKVDLSLRVSEEYTDNVDQTAPDEIDSFITEVRPGIALSDKGAKTDYNFSYDYRISEYSAEDRERRKEHNLNSTINRYEFDRVLKLHANARISNTQSRTTDTTLGDGLTGKERIQTSTYGSGFVLDSGARQWHDTMLSGDFQHTEAKNDTLDIDLIDAEFSTQQGKRATNISWTGNATLQEDSEDNSNRFGYAKLGYRFYKFLSLFGQHQYEDNVSSTNLKNLESSWGVGFQVDRNKASLSIAYNKIEKGEKDAFTSVDFNWSPSTRTSISGSYTHRFFGESYQFSLSHNSRKLRNQITYSDDITTFARENISQEFGFLICPQGQVSASACFVPASLNQPIEPGFELVGLNLQNLNISDEQILNRTLRYISTYSFSKTTLSASAFWNRTKSLSDENFNTNEYDSETGGTLEWLWKATSKTNVNLSTSYRDIVTDKDTVEEVEAKERSIRASVSKTFSKKITGALSYTYLNRDSKADADSFIENRFAVSGLIQF